MNSTQSTLMLLRGSGLSVKITAILLGFFLAALTAIGLTLFISWHLEGAAAAINDAGSLRMRMYRLAHHLARTDELGQIPSATFAADLRQRADEFENVLANLRAGDPKRPLFLPRDDGIPEDVERLYEDWRTRLRPILDEVVNTPTPAMLHARALEFDAQVAAAVATIDDIVLRMEHSYGRNTNILRASQVVLVVLAVIGTFVLLRFFFLTVIRPLYELQVGVKRMETEDFDARVPVLANDEFGELSAGFNQMAAHLQDLYATLEERVDAKTRSLESRNRELRILYDIVGFLREPNDVDSLCRGFLERVQKTMRATAGSARLLDLESRNLCMIVHDGLADDFLDREEVLACGECVCGEVVQGGRSLALDVREGSLDMTRDACARAGFQTVSATSITANKRPLGVFNLFFATPTSISEQDSQLLETLGQQLGIAIENQRLHARERELAVSEERNLLARELHDSIAQGLAFLNLQVQMLERALAENKEQDVRNTVDMLRRGIQESYEDVRELLVHFRTRVEQQDLDAAIAAALRRLAEQTGVATDLEVQGDGAPLDPEAETQVLYIVQEALSNVRKHANASSVSVSLRRGRHGLSVTVRDDGVGFVEGRAADDGGEAHIGLQIMRERALRIGGHFAVRSSPGRGTELRLQLPRTNNKVAA
ncbi:type IV pili methyl-accepting chemotaxis transducer N-terminal domain-containing protein [Thauera aromatica]|uniref:type IV pili methyl-accepting chemotaxis transducer N-terminal domain-containing protein n=1 Tax=Thauera aromatica TaxID=59405 RepID=UPI001FFDA317|nr:type IV pili methyl-accepting chemotaxis transducer N-terminal domain-containing protein [Thauera aromatica]MCK2087761.1 type IV pili methyl-accepting chemotaxis transducer N-terminal domain-containing protein [Thauera aromatica]